MSGVTLVVRSESRGTPGGFSMSTEQDGRTGTPAKSHAAGVGVGVGVASDALLRQLFRAHELGALAKGARGLLRAGATQEERSAFPDLFAPSLPAASSEHGDEADLFTAPASKSPRCTSD